MDGTSDPFEENHEVTIKYKVIIDEGNVSVLEGTDIFMPDIKCKILSPQDNLMYIQRLDNPEGYFTVT